MVSSQLLNIFFLDLLIFLNKINELKWAESHTVSLTNFYKQKQHGAPSIAHTGDRADAIFNSEEPLSQNLASWSSLVEGGAAVNVVKPSHETPASSPGPHKLHTLLFQLQAVSEGAGCTGPGTAVIRLPSLLKWGVSLVQLFGSHWQSLCASQPMSP